MAEEFGIVSERSKMGARLSPANFNQLAPLIPPGKGWYQTIPIPLNATLVTGFSLALTSGMVVAVMDTNTDSIALNFVMPGNYDQVKDKFRVNVYAIAVGTSALQVGTTAGASGGVSYWRPTGTAVTTPTLTAAQYAAQTISTTTFTKYTYPLNGLGIKPYDVLTVVMGSTTMGTSITVRGIEVEYAAGLVIADKTLRA